MQHLCVLFLASSWSFCALGRRNRAAGYPLREFALQSCDSTRGSHRGTRVGVKRRGLEASETWLSLRHRSPPGGSSLCFLSQLIFYISFRLSFMSQARRQEAPVGRLHFRARLRWEHRVTPIMKGRDGLASLQGGHLFLDRRQQDGLGMLLKK